MTRRVLPRFCFLVLAATLFVPIVPAEVVVTACASYQDPESGKTYVLGDRAWLDLIVNTETMEIDQDVDNAAYIRDNYYEGAQEAQKDAAEDGDLDGYAIAYVDANESTTGEEASIDSSTPRGEPRRNCAMFS